MSLFTIDQNKCTSCKICMAECPMQIIIMKKDSKIPEPASYAEKLCIDCGHCVSVCPEGAFSLKTMSADKCIDISEDYNPGPEKITGYMKARRSVRKFKDLPVEKAVIEQIIDTASCAPSGHNSRPVEWTVIEGREKIKEMAVMVVDWMKDMQKNSPEMAAEWHFDMIIKAWEFNIDVITHSCHAVIIAHGDKKNPNAAQAGTIALSHFEMAAPSFGLGCCWGGFLTWAAMMWQPLKDHLNLPKGHSLQGTMLTGYPKFKYHRMPLRESKVTWK